MGILNLQELVIDAFSVIMKMVREQELVIDAFSVIMKMVRELKHNSSFNS